MWTYLDRVLGELTQISLVVPLADHKIVRVSLRLVNRPSLASYWKFNTSLLEIRDFREWLDTLIQQALVRAVAGNWWWESLKYRSRDVAIKYDQQLQLDRAKKAKSLEDRLSRAVEVGDSLAVDLAWRDIEREASERYKGFVVRNRLKRVSNEAVRYNALMCKEELRRYTEDTPIEFVKSSDGRVRRSNRGMREVFWAHFRDRFAHCPDHSVQEFFNYLTASCEGLITECEVRNALKQVCHNKSPGLDGLPYEVYWRMLHMFVPILTDVFNHWLAQWKPFLVALIWEWA